MGEVATQESASVESYIVEFTSGLYGFPSVRRYVIKDIPGGGDVLKQMLALDEADLGFTLVYPFAFFPDYAPEVSDEEVHELGAESPEQLLVMVIANVPADFKEMTVNLKAPIIFNPYTRKACQVILGDERYTTRHRLFKA